jgi:hypothetical protein
MDKEVLHIELALLAAQWRPCGPAASRSVPALTPALTASPSRCTRRTIGGAGLVTRAQCREATSAIASGEHEPGPRGRVPP